MFPTGLSSAYVYHFILLNECVANSALQIKKRGAAPLGGGEVQFICPIVKQVKTVNFVDPGKIKRIRGIAYVRPTVLSKCV